MPGAGRAGEGLIAESVGKGRQILRLGELLLFPSRCRICDALLEDASEKVVCRTCVSGLIPHSLPRCERCGRYFFSGGESHLCAACLELPPPFSCHRSAGMYKGTLKDLVLLLKYRGYQPVAGILVDFIMKILAAEDRLWRDLDGVTAVPLHPRRKRERGFNQSMKIAAELARRRKIPLIRNNLRKVKNTVPQTMLDGRERRSNVRGAYEVRKPHTVQGKTILLVDDVYTTGATVAECCSVLLKAGAEEVRVVTAAQA